MRYPVGVRRTWAGAIEAANEAAQLTGVRYHVRRMVDLELKLVWYFGPRDTPDPTRHMPIYV